MKKKLPKPSPDTHKERHARQPRLRGWEHMIQGTQVTMTTDFFLGSVKARRQRKKSIKC